MGGLLFRPSQPSITQSSTRQQTTTASSSIDPEDLKKFQKLSASWWVENGEFEALHRMNQLRVPWIRDTMVNYKNLNHRSEEAGEEKKTESVSEPLSGLRILDVGCGGGILSEVSPAFFFYSKVIKEGKYSAFLLHLTSLWQDSAPQ